MIFIGIDPGITGAVATIDTTVLEYRSDQVNLWDTPVVVLKKSNGKNKTDYLPSDMAELLKSYKGVMACHAFIEQVSAMPGQGVTSMFGFGKGYGLWIGILAALKIPYTLVTPQAWKKELMLGKMDKSASLVRAQELFPSAVGLTRKKDIGRADALLIAEYGRRTWR